jgi:hypothetical protein
VDIPNGTPRDRLWDGSKIAKIQQTLPWDGWDGCIPLGGERRFESLGDFMSFVRFCENPFLAGFPLPMMLSRNDSVFFTSFSAYFAYSAVKNPVLAFSWLSGLQSIRVISVHLLAKAFGVRGSPGPDTPKKIFP